MPGDELVRTEGLKKYYEVRGGVFRRTLGYVKAVDGVDLTIRLGETLGLVGESGSGKTTLGMVLGKLVEPRAGRYLFNGVDVTRSVPRELRWRIRVVFQDPYSALNPRLKVVDAIAEPLVAQGHDRREAVEKAKELVRLVGLLEAHLSYYPHMLSGGQRQRVLIARALATDPYFVVLDEPTSMLDVSTQAQILRLLKKVKEQNRISYLFITHNLAVARYISDRIAVMYAGQIVEEGNKSRVFEAPLHPYTRALLSAYPSPDPRVPWNPQVPEELRVSYDDGRCRYYARCPLRSERCGSEMPELVDVGNGHKVRCHLYAG